MNDKKCATPIYGKYRQLFVAGIVNLLSLSVGIHWGWPSPVTSQLRSSNPPVGDTPMSADQIARISSLMAIGGLLTTPFCGTLSEKIGRKNFAHLTGLPHIASWLLIIFGQSCAFIYAARLMCGMATAMTIFIAPLYVTEICSKDIRGSLGCILVFAMNNGTLFAYVVGTFASYRLFACLCLFFPLLFVAVFGLMPETPIFLVRRNQSLQAHKSLMFLRGNNQAAVEEELVSLQVEVKASSGSFKKLGLSDILLDRATRKGLIICFGLLGAQQLSGIFAMISYAETIFKRAGTPLSAETASMVIAAIQIVSSCTSSLLMDRAGRRPLTLISCIGMAISHFLVGLFFHLQHCHIDVSSISWMPLVALSTYIVNFCLGLGPVSMIVISEVFNLEVSSIATTLCFVFYWVMSFAAIQAFTLATQLLGIGRCFFMFAVFCLVSFAFSYWLLPETKGRERQDIVSELAGKGLSDERICGSDKKVNSFI